MLRTLFDRDTWQEIFGSIAKNKLRTVVTVIGVLWGIFIYITLSGASKGLDNGFEREFEEVAINSLFIWAQNTSIPYDGFRTGRRMQLKLDDEAFLNKRIPQLQYIAPRIARGAFGGSGSAVKRKGKSGSYAIYGDFPILIKIATKDIYNGGRFINQYDIEQQRKVCVIGERTQAELFETKEDPIGAFIEIDGMYFKVVGVHKFTPGGGFESDSDIFIPFTTFKLLYNTGDRVSWFAMAAYDDADVVAVEADIKAALRVKHRVHPDDERAFGSFNLGEIFNKVKGFSSGMYILSLIVGIATILAGVVGIGNILLISVRERTKELGIRRALGATPSEVRSQIIIESVFLTLIAGIIGIILGAFVLALLGYSFKDPLIPFVNPTVPIKFILGALVLMVGLGTLDALREE